MSITNNYETLDVQCENQVVHVTINRPDKLNALNELVLNELKSVLIEINQDKDYAYKGVTLTGSGEKAFIAGADISQMQKMDVKAGEALGKLGQEVSLLFEKLRVPVIAAVNGFALGGGCEMAMSCDIILATENARFGQPEVKLGLIPGFGGTQRLPRYIGRSRAKELTYSGRHINAQKAKDWGLVSEVFATKDELLAAAEKIHNEIQSNSPYAVTASKRAINEGCDLDLANGLRCELDQFAVVFASEDKNIGIDAFLGKKTPEFVGK